MEAAISIVGLGSSRTERRRNAKFGDASFELTRVPSKFLSILRHLALCVKHMKKTLNCTKCHECFKIEGSIEGLREIEFDVLCPHCQTSNKIQWPMAGDFTIVRCDEGEPSE